MLNPGGSAGDNKEESAQKAGKEEAAGQDEPDLPGVLGGQIAQGGAKTKGPLPVGDVDCDGGDRS